MSWEIGKLLGRSVQLLSPKIKRDFSLRRPSASQERSGKKKRRPASLEMTGRGKCGIASAMTSRI